jgi:signal transduction histidine kinase
VRLAKDVTIERRAPDHSGTADIRRAKGQNAAFGDHESARSMNEKAASTRRLTLLALLVIAVLAVPGAVYLAYSWSKGIETIGNVPDEEYRVQGIAWGEFYRNLLVSWARPSQPGAGDVRLQFCEMATRRLSTLLKQRPEIAPSELAVLRVNRDRTEAATLMSVPGRPLDRYPEESDYKEFAEADLRVAVMADEVDTIVVVRAPIRATSLPDDLEVRCALRYRNVKSERIRGENYYYAVVGGIFLFLLYAIFVTIYVLGRGEVSTIFRSKEKEIRLKAMGQVAEGIAHEVRNPLNGVSLMVQYLEKVQDKAGRKPRPEDFQRIHIEVGKIRKVIDNFVSFAKLREIELQEFDMGQLVQETIDSFAPTIADAKISVKRTTSGDLFCVADRPKLAQVVRTILENAIEAVKESSRREIAIDLSAEKNLVRLRVEDSGPSMTPSQIHQLFDPYAATTRANFGLGLTVARTVVESHGGSIRAVPGADFGCTIVVDLPRAF